MKEWMALALGLFAAAAVEACDSRHCGTRAAATTDAAAPADSGLSDAPIEKISILLPEAGDLRAADAGDTSSVSVKGTFNACPDIFAATASPPAATVGETILVGVSASDPDPGDQLTYAWSATSGSFGTPLAASSTYVCSAEEMVTITIKVSDGGCTETGTITVTCRAARAADGSADGTDDR